ncbi:MAG TPA: pentapeptide repeat-containing protein [Stenomitos sp.]
MSEISAGWIATLRLGESLGLPSYPQEFEPYILSKKESTFIGRSADCQIVLRPKYSTASRYHAKVELVEISGEFIWQVCDLGTPNGTFVNDQKIKDCHPLKSGDILTLGKPKGANFIFEYKAIESDQLHQLLHREQPYDQTFVPSLDDLGQEHWNLQEEDEETQFFARQSSDPQEAAVYSPASVNSELSLDEAIVLHSTSPAKSEPSPLQYANQEPERKSFRPGKLSAKSLIIIALILTIPFLAYRIPELFKAQRSNNEVIEAYINNISKLLIERQLDNIDPFNVEAQKVRESANAQTRIALKNLDRQAKGSLIRFLHESKLIKLQPSLLSKVWSLNGNKITNKGPIELATDDLERRELVYLRQLLVGPYTESPPPVFLLNQSVWDQKTFATQHPKCKATVAADVAKSCALAVVFRVPALDPLLLTPIRLSGTDLTGIRLKDAPLENINLEGAYLSFQSCKPTLSGNFLEDTFYYQWSNWSSQGDCKADLSHAGLQGARLVRAVLMGANLSHAKLDRADLRQADLRGANLQGVSWQGARLMGACYLQENWQSFFPTTGPDGKPFDPIALGMKPTAAIASDPNDSRNFQECKALPSPKS